MSYGLGTVTSPAGERDQTPAFLLFLLLDLAFNFDRLLGPCAVVRIHDTFDSEFIEYFLRGRLHLEYGLFGWAPHYAGGMPAFAFQFPPYYPWPRYWCWKNGWPPRRPAPAS